MGAFLQIEYDRFSYSFKSFDCLNPYPFRCLGRDPFNQNSDRSDREKRTTSKHGPVFSKLFRLDQTDPLSFGPKFPEILVEWIAPLKPVKIPKWSPTLKWYQNQPRNDPHFSSRHPRNDPQLILEMQWYTRTMDRAKYTTLIKALL